MFLRNGEDLRKDILSIARTVNRQSPNLTEVRAATADNRLRVVCKTVATHSGKPGRWHIEVIGPKGGFRGKFCSRITDPEIIAVDPHLQDFVNRWFGPPRPEIATAADEADDEEEATAIA